LYLDKEVAEGTLKEYQPISIFGEVNTDQLSAYRPTHFRSFLPSWLYQLLKSFLTALTRNPFTCP